MVASEIKKKVCLLSSSPHMLGCFYKSLMKQLIELGYDLTLVTSQGDALQSMKDELSCNAFSTLISRKITPLQDIKSIFRLRSYFRRQKIDLIHAHTPKGGLIGMISAWLARVPNRIYTIHGLPMETAGGLKRKLLWSAEWLTCKLATDVLAVSQSLRQRVLEEKLCKSEKINIFDSGSACGIDINKFELDDKLIAEAKKIRSENKIPDNDVVIGFVGRFVFDKGIKTLIDSFVRIRQQRQDVHLMLVGGLDEVRDCLPPDIIEFIKSGKNVHWVGFANNPAPFYAAMDILTLPSRREGFGLTLIEAAAVSRPTIATRVTGCVNAIQDGQTGLLVEVDNSDELFEAMKKLVEDPDLRKKFGLQGRQRVEKLFDSRVLIDRHIKFYQQKLT